MSRLSLVEGIACGVYGGDKFSGFAWCDRLDRDFQDVTCVIHDVTLLDTENRKRYR